ncbi:MAG: acyl-CoA dehydrogenase family protein, partial [Dehalococcoidia bacterium]|nr:acyl-CoA dehydrogenase family protein [Dehalococcoidia bacterium]
MLTDVQTQLVAAVSAFAADLATHGVTRVDRAMWHEMAALGWLSVPFGPEVGGAGLGWTEFGLVVEATAQAGVLSPLIAAVAEVGPLLAATDTPASQDALRDLIAGRVLIVDGTGAPMRLTDGHGDGLLVAGSTPLVADADLTLPDAARRALLRALIPARAALAAAPRVPDAASVAAWLPPPDALIDESE